jgi:hypothetical protein
MKILGKNIEKSGVISSVLISLIALGISFKSCCDSNEALELSKKEFQAKRFLILKSELGNASPGFEFKTFDENQKLQKILIHLPSQFQEKEIAIESSVFYFDLSELQDSLLVILKRNIPDYKPTDRINVRNVPIPTIIVSNYIVAGEALSDSSLYNLEFSFRQEYINNSPESQIEFKNLIFIKRLIEEGELDKNLSEYWIENFDTSLNTLESK